MTKPLYERTSAYACFGKGPFSKAALEAIERDRKLKGNPSEDEQAHGYKVVFRAVEKRFFFALRKRQR